MRTVAVLVSLFLTTAARAAPGDRWDGVMIAEQAGAGALGGVALGAAGLGIGIAIGSDDDSEFDMGAVFGGGIGGSIGGITGVIVGVKLAGDLRGGNGGWGATTIGAGIGALLTFAAVIPTEKVPTPARVAIYTVTMLTPPIVAYHLSTDENASSTERRVMVPLFVGGF